MLLSPENLVEANKRFTKSEAYDPSTDAFVESESFGFGAMYLALSPEGEQAVQE